MRDEELHIVRMKRELDAMLEKKTLNKSRVVEILDVLCPLNVDTEMLQRTGIGLSMNNIRKAFAKTKDIGQRAGELVKRWKDQVKTEHEQRHVTEPVVLDEDEDVFGVGLEPSCPQTVDHSYFHGAAGSEGKRSSTDTGQSEGSSSQDSEPSGIANAADDTRAKSVELLHQALTGDDNSTRESQRRAWALASEIERYIYAEFGTADDHRYKARVRSRVMNLRDEKNDGLRQKILDGKLAPKRVASMAVDELANDQMKKLRRSIEVETIHEHEMVPDVANSRTEEYKCENCGERDASYNVGQEQVGNEHGLVPVTQILCNKCGYRWRQV